MRCTPLLFLITWALGSAGRAAAQSDTARVAGHILDGETGAPIAGASLALVDLGRGARTDDSGGFAFEALRPGTYRLRAIAIGYTATVWLVRAEGRSERRDTLLMMPHPVVLDTVHVRGAPDNDWRSPDALERRRQKGDGHFLMREDIDAREAVTLGDLLQAIPGVVTQCRMGECRTVMTHTGAGCQPNWYVDGFPATFAGGPEFPSRFIEAVEVYANPSDAPIEMQRPGLRCGVIAIWTRRKP